LRRRRAECHVGKAGGHTVRGWLALTVRQPCEQQRPEAKRLLARRGLHQLRVLPPESVTQLDSAALHLEHQQAAPGLGDDEVALPAPSLARLDAERVPGVPARRQLRAQRLVDAHLRARAGRPRVLARIDARGGKHLWSLAGPGRFYIGPIWRVLEVSLHLLDLCEELPSRFASARPDSAQSWAWALLGVEPNRLPRPSAPPGHRRAPRGAPGAVRRSAGTPRAPTPHASRRSRGRARPPEAIGADAGAWARRATPSRAWRQSPAGRASGPPGCAARPASALRPASSPACDSNGPRTSPANLLRAGPRPALPALRRRRPELRPVGRWCRPLPRIPALTARGHAHRATIACRQHGS